MKKLALDLNLRGGQLAAVFMFLRDGEWHSISEMVEAIGSPGQSISARIRDLRKAEYGGHTVLTRLTSSGGKFRGAEYRLLVNPDCEVIYPGQRPLL